MQIPTMKNYPLGEYSLIQISPTIDSQELINIGVIVKSFQDNRLKIQLFDDMSKLLKRVHIENSNSLEYALSILKKSIEKNHNKPIYRNLANIIKINTPVPISITEPTLDKQLEKLFQEKITLLKTFPAERKPTLSHVHDKNNIINNLNSYIKTNNLGDVIKTRRKILTTLGVKKQIDTVAFNQENEPVIVSDIISPATSRLDEMYVKSLFTLNNLMGDTIREKIFYIPTIEGIARDRLDQIQQIKTHIRSEGIEINDSRDPKEFIESLALRVETFS